MARNVAQRVRGAVKFRAPVAFVPILPTAAIWKQASAGWPWLIASVLAVIAAGLALTWVVQEWMGRSRPPRKVSRLEAAVLRHFRGHHGGEPSHPR